jgi:putative redox protein
MLYLKIRRAIMDDVWREVTAEWKGDHAFIGRNKSGGIVQMGTLDDEPGLSPMELLLAGMAGCTGIDVVDILKKKKQPLDAIEVRVRGRRVDSFPRIYKEIEVRYMIWGNGIDVKAVEHAIKLSEEKYCSVSAMLRGVAEIRSSYIILAPGEDAM